MSQNFSFASLVFLASFGTAFASTGRPVVVCNDVPFSDLKRIEIRETDLEGQYLVVETASDRTERYSPVFGANELEKGEYPALSSWNGYERRLVRYGRDSYSITIQDECTTSVLSLDCKDSF